MDLKTFLSKKAVKQVAIGDDVTAYVRPLSVAETQWIDRECKGIPEAERSQEMAFRMVLLGTCDSSGNAVFTSKSVDEIKNLPAGVFTALIEACAEVNDTKEIAKKGKKSSTKTPILSG